MSDDEQESNICPLCVEEMDISDKNFLPCPCGYRVCMWCWHHIRENLNGLCPACRTPYNADPHAFNAIDRQEIVKKNREQKKKEKQEKKVTDKPGALIDRRHLHNYRVVQRNLVYVIGVPLSMASEEMLRKAEYLGQYGKIGKVVIHRNSNTAAAHTTVSAYVTFIYKEDAKASIQSLEGFWIDGHLLRASFGTTKYCNNFIRGMPCNNPDCVYLHEMGDDEDRFTKEEIQAGHSKLVLTPGQNQAIITGNGGPSGTGKRPVGETVFPPPVFIQDINPVNGQPIEREREPLSNNSSENNLSRKNSSWPIINASQSPDLSPIPSPPTPDMALTIDPDSPPFQALPPSANPHTDIAPLELPKASIPTAGKADTAGLAVPKTANTNTGSSPKLNGLINNVAPLSLPINPNATATVPTSNHSLPNPNMSLKVPDGIAALNVTASNSNSNSTLTPSTSTGNVLNTQNSASSNNNSSRTEAQMNQAAAASFNGLGKCAVFPVPVSSLAISVWSGILNSSSANLDVNPFGQLDLPISELLDLTLPPVDAVCMNPWPKPLTYYKQGVGPDGFTHSPVRRHTHKYVLTEQHVSPYDTNPNLNLNPSSNGNINSLNNSNPGVQSYNSILNAPKDIGHSEQPAIGQIGQQPIAALQQMFPSVKIFGMPK